MSGLRNSVNIFYERSEDSREAGDGTTSFLYRVGLIIPSVNMNLKYHMIGR